MNGEVVCSIKVMSERGIFEEVTCLIKFVAAVREAGLHRLVAGARYDSAGRARVVLVPDWRDRAKLQGSNLQDAELRLAGLGLRHLSSELYM